MFAAKLRQQPPASGLYFACHLKSGDSRGVIGKGGRRSPGTLFRAERSFLVTNLHDIENPADPFLNRGQIGELRAPEAFGQARQAVAAKNAFFQILLKSPGSGRGSSNYPLAVPFQRTGWYSLVHHLRAKGSKESKGLTGLRDISMACRVVRNIDTPAGVSRACEHPRVI